MSELIDAFVHGYIGALVAIMIILPIIILLGKIVVAAVNIFILDRDPN